jgi:hypothetical protein
MFNEIKYFAPYFNDTKALREAYQTLYPNYDFDLISSLMVGALSVYVPEEKFQELLEGVLSEANAKLNLN